MSLVLMKSCIKKKKLQTKLQNLKQEVCFTVLNQNLKERKKIDENFKM